ncbi:GxxExxY protein [Pedobacter sp. LMG 31464]|uniref:GxxExxY protein n=1 Tax=Pedobacter planticolens TaxID=2679964 RepID=A0A923IUH8_9SPHI|nr:GxxExxY protein [Pedobacter planticolens]MBB2144179.1 GxxExxY protein [Pedobacter planticolens]
MTKTQITQLSYEITGCAIKVHKSLDPGLLECVYEQCLKYELQKNGFDVKQQLIIPVIYDNLQIDTDLRLDLLVNDLIVVELKTVENILPVHEAQILTYMKLLKVPQGLLINFFTDNISKSMKPFVNEYFRFLRD